MLINVKNANITIGKSQGEENYCIASRYFGEKRMSAGIFSYRIFFLSYGSRYQCNQVLVTICAKYQQASC